MRISRRSRYVKKQLPICPSFVFIPSGNGRSALSSIPAFRRSFLLRSRAVSRASCLRKRAAMSQSRRGNVKPSRRCSHPTRSRPNQESRNQNRSAKAGSHADTCRRISRQRRSGNLAGLVRVPGEGVKQRTARFPRIERYLMSFDVHFERSTILIFVPGVANCSEGFTDVGHRLRPSPSLYRRAGSSWLTRQR
jgi:hypothetical protein